MRISYADIDDIKVVLVDTGAYSVASLDTRVPVRHHWWCSHRDIVEPDGKDSTAGVADANDVTSGAVIGAQSEALLIYKDTRLTAQVPLSPRLIRPGGFQAFRMVETLV